MLTSALVSLSTVLNTCKASSHGAEDEAARSAPGLVLDKTAGFCVWSLKEDTSNRNISPALKAADKAAPTETSIINTSTAEITDPVITGTLTETPEGALLLYFGPDEFRAKAKVLKLTSPKQMFDMSQRFLDLAFAEKAKTDNFVLTLCNNAYESPPDRGIGDIERFWFRSITAQSLVHSRLAEANAETAREHYEHIVSLINAYESYFKDLQCNSTTQEKIKFNFIDLCHFAAKAYGHLSSIYDADHSITKETARYTALKSIQYGEDYILRLNMLAKEAKKVKDEKSIKLLEIKQSLLLTVKNNLMVAYFSVYQYAYFDKNQHLHEAYSHKIKGFYSELKKSAEFNQNSMKIRDALRLFDESQKSTSGALANYKKARTAEKTVELLRLVQAQDENKKVSKNELMNDQWKKVLLQIELDIKTAIAKKTIAQPNAVSFESLAFIAELENMIFKTIDSGEYVTSETLPPSFVLTKTKHFSVISLRDTVAELQNIYREYQKIFGSEKFLSAYCQYPLAFLYAGDIDGALARVNAFESVSGESDETPNALSRCVAALVKSLHGNYADLLALQEEASDIVAQRNAARQQNRKKAHSAKVDSIGRAQKELAEAAAARSKAEGIVEERRRERMISRSQAGDIAGGSVTYYDLVSTGASKAEKKLRHEKAQHKKMAEAAYEDSSRDHEKISVMPASSDTSESDSEISTLKLSELYNLSGVARDVNEKIEAGSWDFTRQDLVAYYVAMGCEKRSGRGSHEVVEFGSSFAFSKDGELITVLSDFGGALTLPRWDDTVPHYLRKQIQVAREKLTRFAKRVRDL